jgi:hypothetical protein
MVATRQFGACFLVLLATFAILFPRPSFRSWCRRILALRPPGLADGQQHMRANGLSITKLVINQDRDICAALGSADSLRLECHTPSEPLH